MGIRSLLATMKLDADRDVPRTFRNLALHAIDHFGPTMGDVRALAMAVGLRDWTLAMALSGAQPNRAAVIARCLAALPPAELYPSAFASTGTLSTATDSDDTEDDCRTNQHDANLGKEGDVIMKKDKGKEEKHAASTDSLQAWHGWINDLAISPTAPGMAAHSVAVS